MLTLPVPFGVSTILELPALVVIFICDISVMLPVMIRLPPILILPTADIFPAIILPVPDIVPPDPDVNKLPPVMLPVADIKPVTYSPVVANTATFDVPPMPTDTLPPELTTVTFDVPLLILATEVITPVNSAPLPKI